MNILCLTPWFPAHREDQQGNFILDSIESLVELGHNITVLLTHPWRPWAAQFLNRKWQRKKIQIEQFSQFHFHTCHYFSIPRSYFASFSHWSYQKNVNHVLEKLVSKYQCQLIHAHTELAGISAVNIGRKMNIPTVVTLHGISTEKKLYVGKTRKLLFENTLSNADRVVVVGKPLLDFSKEFVTNLHHFRVVGNGFRQSNNNNRVVKKIFIENVIHFISVSNLEEGKGIDINLHALAKLKKSGMTHWTYKIVGDGAEQKKLKKLTNELNLKDHVTFIGACDHHEVYSHLQQSDAFILPSYREAFGVAYLEAMSCGLLTLGVKGQGPEEFIEHEKTGLLVDPKNVDALTNMLKYILESPKNMIDIANNGKQHVHRYFTWHAHAKNLENVYRELL